MGGEFTEAKMGSHGLDHSHMTDSRKANRDLIYPLLASTRLLRHAYAPLAHAIPAASSGEAFWAP